MHPSSQIFRKVVLSDACESTNCVKNCHEEIICSEIEVFVKKKAIGGLYVIYMYQMSDSKERQKTKDDLKRSS